MTLELSTESTYNLYKQKGELRSLQRSRINEGFGEFERNMVELTTWWDQSSIDPTT